MMTSTLQEFLLFNFQNWTKYGNSILDVCQYALYPVFVFALLFDKASQRPDPMGVLKRLLIAQFIILSIPTYYKSVAGFGFKIGDSILEGQRIGLIANWNKFKKKAERQAKRNQEKSDFLTTVSSFFSFDGTDIVEKAAALIIFICILLIKIIYSVVYYSTYCTSGILAALSVFPFFSSYTSGIIKSVFYLIISAVIIAFVLTFLNDTLNFTVSKDGFIENLSGIAKFLVLCFVLLGSLKISYSLVNGSGPEGWGGNMGQMLGAGLAYKAMSMGFNFTKDGSKVAIGSSYPAVMGAGVAATTIGKNLSLFTAKPITAAAKGIVSKARTDINNKASLIAKNHKGSVLNNNSNRSENISYESALSNLTKSNTGGSSYSANLNPINHARAAKVATKDFSSRFIQERKVALGLPVYSKELTAREKVIFMANRRLNPGLVPSKKEQIERQLVLNKIAKAMEKNNDR